MGVGHVVRRRGSPLLRIVSVGLWLLGGCARERAASPPREQEREAARGGGGREAGFGGAPWVLAAGRADRALAGGESPPEGGSAHGRHRGGHWGVSRHRREVSRPGGSGAGGGPAVVGA